MPGILSPVSTPKPSDVLLGLVSIWAARLKLEQLDMLSWPYSIERMAAPLWVNMLGRRSGRTFPSITYSSMGIPKAVGNALLCYSCRLRACRSGTVLLRHRSGISRSKHGFRSRVSVWGLGCRSGVFELLLLLASEALPATPLFQIARLQKCLWIQACCNVCGVYKII